MFKGKKKDNPKSPGFASSPNKFFGRSSRKDGGDDDSVSSVSTMETMDDNPGTGRMIDKHVYQKLGGKIERLFCRIGMSFLSPDRIVRYIVSQKTSSSLIGIDVRAIRETNSLTDYLVGSYGAPVLAGVKSLVRQTR